MTIRETTIAKLTQLPEPLLQQVNDFIDRLMPHSKPGNGKPEEAMAETWLHWFEVGDQLETMPTEPTSDYQQLLLSKYRQQGLEL